MNKKIVSGVSCALGIVILGSTLAACVKKSYDYVAVDPGTLQAPKATFKTAAEDAAVNAEYRKAYPTMERYKDTVTVTVGVIQYDLESNVKEGTTPKNQSFNQIALEKLNIKIDYRTIAASTVYEAKLNLAISAGNMPDMFYTTSSARFTELRDDGALADLTDSLYMLNDNLLSNYLNYMPELLTACQKDGKLYALPQQTNRFTTAQRLYIRKDWLDIVGMEAPKTIDEMIEVGEAFLEHKSEIAQKTGIAVTKVIPFSMHKDITYAGSYSAAGMFNAHGASLGGYFLGDDGKLYSSDTSPQALATVKTLRTMYEKGILDPEFTTNTAASVQSYVGAGYVGMVFGEWWLPKDAVGTAVSSDRVNGADWVWVDLPTYGTAEKSLPIVDTMLISGYNLVSAKCKNPEAVAKLMNLFYDIYYNDNAENIYGKGVLPSNGFYYQFVPVKVWDGMSSAVEYKRVQSVFNNLYATGKLSDRATLNQKTEKVNGLYEFRTNDEIAADEEKNIKVYKISAKDDGFWCLKRDVVQTIEGNTELKAEFDKLRNREKILHFADGYPYFVAYKQNVKTSEMTDAEKKGWGIYHEMIDENGSFAYVVKLAEGQEGKDYKCNEFYGTSLSAMSDFGDYVTKKTSEYFTKMISCKSQLTAFDEYVNVYNRGGGDTIINQVNAWYKAVHAFD